MLGGGHTKGLLVKGQETGVAGEGAVGMQDTDGQDLPAQGLGGLPWLPWRIACRARVGQGPVRRPG